MPVFSASPVVSRLRPSLLALALMPATVFANDNDADTLDTVVVTASGMQQWLSDAPASMSVITREEIERKPVTSIAELLGTLPGVSGGLAASGGQSKINLRGLPYQYTLILIDGRRQGNSLGTNYRDDLGRQDLDWISPEMIERIEIVRGPMSSLYGSDAMGGVINIITRKIHDRWGGSASANYTRQESSERGDSSQLGFNVGGPLTDTLSLRLGLAQSKRDSDRPARAGTGQSPGFRNNSADMLLRWQLNDSHTLEAQATRGVQQAIGSDLMVRNTNKKCDPATDSKKCLTASVGAWGAEQLTHTGYGLFHEGFYGDVSSSKTSFNSNRYVNLGSWDKDKNVRKPSTESNEWVLDTSFNTELDWGLVQTLTAGAQWKHEELFNPDTVGSVEIDWTGGDKIAPRGKANAWAIFGEDQLSLKDNLALTLGLRLDNTDNYKNHVSPRSYLVWHPAESWTVRGGISQGYKAPNLKEGSAGAATESGGRGCHALDRERGENGTCYMAGNPNLKPETSTSYEIGAGFDRSGYTAAMTYFVTNFDDKIEQVPLKKIPGYEDKGSFVHGKWWTVAQNLEKARTRGLEANVTIPLHARLEWTANATRMFESKNLTTKTDLLVTPKLSAHTELNFRPLDTLLVSLSAQHVGKQNTSSKDPTFAHATTTYDLTFNWSVRENLTVRAGMRNLGDVSTLKDGNGKGNRYDGGSRAYFVGVSGKF